MNFGGIQAWAPITGLMGRGLSDDAEQQMLCFCEFEIRDILLVAHCWIRSRQHIPVLSPQGRPLPKYRKQFTMWHYERVNETAGIWDSHNSAFPLFRFGSSLCGTTVVPLREP